MDPETLECPSGTLPCSAVTSPENTLCHGDAKDCPITDFLFVDAATDASSYPEYTIIPWTDSRSIAYTKTAVDRLPITATQIG